MFSLAPAESPRQLLIEVLPDERTSQGRVGGDDDGMDGVNIVPGQLCWADGFAGEKAFDALVQLPGSFGVAVCRHHVLLINRGRDGLRSEAVFRTRWQHPALVLDRD